VIPADAVPFGEALRFWLKLGFISFGGPTGQIAIMHQELVEKRRWISEGRFLHALNFCMLLPGPEATQLATYIGWLMHRTWGGLVAGTLFVLPSYSENFGIAVIEALACGVPVLISDRVNIWREVVTDGAGAAAPPDIEAFAERLGAMLDDPGNLVRMGQAGLAAVARRYDWANIAERLEAVYAGILAGKRAFS